MRIDVSGAILRVRFWVLSLGYDLGAVVFPVYGNASLVEGLW